MKTTITSYNYDVSDPEQAKQYEALKEKLKGRHRMHSHGGIGGGHCLAWAKEGLDIKLETKHLFSNQWNTGPIDGVSESGYRVFDWASDACLPRKSIKRGHYLEITPEMDEIRRNTYACGFCGFQAAAQKGHTFCPKCIGSKYLKEKELPLLRMQSIADRSSRDELSEAERNHLLPLFKEAQGLTAGKARTDKRNKIIADCEKAIESETRKATATKEGYLWLMDNGLADLIDNAIYYSHKDRFGFGWREPIPWGDEPDLIANLVGFPFDYDIKTSENYGT